MFLRKKRSRVAGETYECWSLCESVRTAKGPRQREVACLGKLDEEDGTCARKLIDVVSSTCARILSRFVCFCFPAPFARFLNRPPG